jgi:hypothetical protein
MECAKSPIVLSKFKDGLPKKPYCSDDPKRYGTSINTRDKAINFAHIQPNHPYYTSSLVFDLDYPVIPEFDYSMFGFPMPNIITENPQNGHAHAIYQLETPIYKTDASRPKPIAFGNAIQRALEHVLGADPAYPSLLTKNPFSEQWRVYTPREKPYSLNELADLLELNELDLKKQIKPSEAKDLGRNCCMFDAVRHWAYVEVRQYRRVGYRGWHEAVLNHCLEFNKSFPIPLSRSEVRSIAKSIANYCQRKDPYHYQEFINRQTMKGKLGASKGGKARSDQYASKKAKAVLLKQAGKNNTEIAKELDVSRRTLINWFNSIGV